jgi:hypothetical protein
LEPSQLQLSLQIYSVIMSKLYKGACSRHIVNLEVHLDFAIYFNHRRINNSFEGWLRNAQ